MLVVAEEPHTELVAQVALVVVVMVVNLKILELQELAALLIPVEVQVEL
jgi:hypothetical protein